MGSLKTKLNIAVVLFFLVGNLVNTESKMKSLYILVIVATLGMASSVPTLGDSDDDYCNMCLMQVLYYDLKVDALQPATNADRIVILNKFFGNDKYCVDAELEPLQTLICQDTNDRVLAGLVKILRDHPNEKETPREKCQEMVKYTD